MKLRNKDVIKILNEIVDPNSIDVEHLNKKDELCPLIWDSEDKMNPKVRKALLKNAKAFIEYLDLDEYKFNDITLTGSLANYNWTMQSDLDVHILMDYSDISDNSELLSNYFRSKKNIWASKVPVTVKDHDVELYIQDINEPHASTGVYSIFKDKWVTKPIKTMISVDTNNIKIKAAEIMNAIDDLEKIKDENSLITIATAIMDRIKKMRQAGLEDKGEFSTENLVFKVLRNNGYLEKLTDYKNNALQSDLMLEDELALDEGKVQDVIRKAKNAGVLTIGMVVGLVAAEVPRQALVQSGVPQEMVRQAEDFIKNRFPLLGKQNKEIDNEKEEIHNQGEPIQAVSQ